MRGSPLPLQSHLPSTLPDLLSAFRDLSVRFLPDVLSFSQCLPNDSVCYYAIYHTYLIRFCQVAPVILLTVRCFLPQLGQTSAPCNVISSSCRRAISASAASLNLCRQKHPDTLLPQQMYQGIAILFSLSYLFYLILFIQVANLLTIIVLTLIIFASNCYI